MERGNGSSIKYQPLSGEEPMYPASEKPPPYEPVADPLSSPHVHQDFSNVVIMEQPKPVIEGPLPKDHMLSAVLVTLFCCWPIGVYAIYKANQSKNALLRGDTGGAFELADRAKTAIKVGVVLGIISLIFIIAIRLSRVH